jgi:dipeptidase E
MLGPGRRRMGYVPSCSDPERRYFRSQQDYYAQHGIDLAVYLEPDVDQPAGALDSLLACDAIHLSGGDTAYFLTWLRRRGLLEPLRRYALEGGVLVGVSAGAILMTPDIGTSGLCGDSWEPGMDLRALGLVDFAFLPHLTSAGGKLEAGQAYSRRSGLSVYACQDGDGLAVRGDEVLCVGNVVVIRDGQVVREAAP